MIEGIRTPLTCSHCGGNLIIIDDAVQTTICESCSCRWETRSVPVGFGPVCQVRPETYPQPELDETISPEERLRLL